MNAPRHSQREWLADRNRVCEIANANSPMPEELMCQLTDMMNDFDERIAAAPATSVDDLLAKMIMLLQIALEGFEPNLTWVDNVLREARALVGMGSLAGSTFAPSGGEE